VTDRRQPHRPGGEGWTRRDFVRRVGLATLAAGSGGPLLAACGEDAERGAAGRDPGGRGGAPADFDARYREALRRAEAVGPPARELRLVAEPGEVSIGPGGARTTWLYTGRYPGPEIRVTEGDRLRVTVENRLPEPTTVHWHGVPVPNAMDGVPGVAQPAIPPGETFVYDYVAEPAGTYMYHSHVGLQLDRGLVGPLVIEEREPHVAYDREHILMLDDWLPGEPAPASERADGGMGGMMEGMGGMKGGRENGNGGGDGPGRGMMGRGRGGMMGEQRGMRLVDPARPEYRALLVNGRGPEDPPTFDVRSGERVRLRLVNPASATTFRVAIAGHRMAVTHTDSRPVERVTVDALVIGPGERYDVMVEADNPGAWTVAAESVLGSFRPARAVLRYADAARSRPAEEERPAGLDGGRRLRLSDLRSVEPAVGEGAPAVDRRLELTLSWGMMMNPDRWTIDGARYPDAAPLRVREGERVRVDMVNHSPIHHPMHLHGHFFRAGDALKETVLVPGHMGRRSFTFTADNPGEWLFHCHNLYHLEAGMARVVRVR
jgi:FtsP/CotA-like multicopper oxidase with cupredoxin domain